MNIESKSINYTTPPFYWNQPFCSLPTYELTRISQILESSWEEIGEKMALRPYEFSAIKNNREFTPLRVAKEILKRNDQVIGDLYQTLQDNSKDNISEQIFKGISPQDRPSLTCLLREPFYRKNLNLKKFEKFKDSIYNSLHNPEILKWVGLIASCSPMGRKGRFRSGHGAFCPYDWLNSSSCTINSLRTAVLIIGSENKKEGLYNLLKEADLLACSMEEFYDCETEALILREDYRFENFENLPPDALDLNISNVLSLYQIKKIFNKIIIDELLAEIIHHFPQLCIAWKNSMANSTTSSEMLYGIHQNNLPLTLRQFVFALGEIKKEDIILEIRNTL